MRGKDTTKHVHRLHPYKGKFIPQLVAYFIDEHTDAFKTKAYFKRGDVILDPFSGSGTTLVQANELNMHAIGIDISIFNRLIAEVKLLKYDLTSLAEEIRKIKKAILSFEGSSNILAFDEELVDILILFNNKYFPGAAYKYKINQGEIDENKYAMEKENLFLKKIQGVNPKI